MIKQEYCMEKLKMQSADGVADNIAKIKALFPDCVTESVGADGTLQECIDFDRLRQNLSDTVVEGPDERYQFTWPDKKKAILLANSPINATLRPCREESVDFDNTQNLYIEGDNLDVLKCLKETYLGRVKMIYIDPPYNTGKDFIYEDDFSESNTEYLAKSGQYDAQGNRLVANAESNGRFHTDWLNMIYPRLKVAKDLMAENGVIFISIDGNELENLRKICDEIFGEDNYIGDLVIQTATDNNPRQITTEHEYIISYAKNLSTQEAWVAKNIKAELIQDKYKLLSEQFGNDINKIQIQLRKWIKENSSMLSGVAHYDNVDNKGVFHDGDIANTVFGGYRYDVIHPITGKPCKIPEKGFRFAEETMKKMMESEDIMFGSDETTLIKPKKRLENARDLLRSVIYEDGRASTKQFETLMARDIFSNPKSTAIISRLMEFIVNDDDIVLDFFSGSGTSAEATMRLNENANKSIRFILVQIPENLDSSLISASNRARQTIKNGIRFLDSISKPHLITEIGKERIRRAGINIQNELSAKCKQDNLFKLDSGFRVLKLDSSNMEDVFYSPSELKQDDLFANADNVKSDRTPEDLLFQVMLDLGSTLDSKIERLNIDGKVVFNVAEGYLVACFDKDVNESVVTTIAKMQPQFAVFRDQSLANDSVAANFEQIFKTYSPTTNAKVI